MNIHPIELARAQIAMQTEQFLAAGGHIIAIPNGISGETNPSIWTKGKMIVSDAPKPAVVPKRYRKPDMTEAHIGKRKKAAEARKALSGAVMHCAGIGMSVSATAEAIGITRVHVRKIAAEHGIEFKPSTVGDVARAYLAET